MHVFLFTEILSKTGIRCLLQPPFPPHLHTPSNALSQRFPLEASGPSVLYSLSPFLPFLVSNHLGRNITSQSAYLISEDTPVLPFPPLAHLCS